MWNALHCLTRCLFLALCVLRLADKSEPGFDRLYYFVHKTDIAMEWSTFAFRTVSYFTTAIEDPSVIEDILRNGAEPDEEPVDEEEDDETMESMLLAGHEDDPDDKGISDDDSVLGLPFGSTGEQFGTNIRTLWAKRKVNMVSDFCMLGGCFLPWMRSWKM